MNANTKGVQAMHAIRRSVPGELTGGSFIAITENLSQRRNHVY